MAEIKKCKHCQKPLRYRRGSGGPGRNHFYSPVPCNCTKKERKQANG